ncbi:MAG: cobyric acid synthase [Thermoplasmata archaeon]
MVLGTSSGAGKSLMVTALCKIFSDMGIKVAPFKVQNMSLNAGVANGGEMAYAQIVQSMAAGIEPSVHMNPILLKPEGGKTHVIVQGKHVGTYDSGSYFNAKGESFLDKALESFNILRRTYDLIVIEGAGSPAEINLSGDIANTRFSKLVGASEVLVVDIERGGAFASAVGTLDLVSFNDLIGIIVNKFRGNEKLLKPGYDYIERRFSTKILGTVPFVANSIPEEDSLRTYQGREGKPMVGILKTPNMANATDFEILERYQDIGFQYITKPELIEKCDIIAIPGSKLTTVDLDYLRNEGYIEILRNIQSEMYIIGICGGLQMLGKWVDDVDETGRGKIEGVGLLDITTRLKGRKVVRQVRSRILYPEMRGMIVGGYEIHSGKSVGRPHFSNIISEDGKVTNLMEGSYKSRVIGTYIHGIFDNTSFTQALLNLVRKELGMEPLKLLSVTSTNFEIQRFAEVVKKSIDLDYILNAVKSR